VQTVINGGFGELWAPAGGDAPEWADVARLKLPYRSREIPAGVTREKLKTIWGQFSANPP
jgi:hypothetical protein